MDEEANFGLNRGTFSRGGWVGAILFVSLFLLIGLGTLAGGFAMERQASQGLSWPRASGKVLVSRVIYAYTSGSTTMYTVDVQYRYSVGDAIFNSSKISDGDFTSSDWQAMQGIAARYRPNQTVVVYYDPAKPEHAMLEPGYGSQAWIPYLIGGIFTLVGAGLGLGLVWVWSRPYIPPKKRASKRQDRHKESDNANL